MNAKTETMIVIDALTPAALDLCHRAIAGDEKADAAFGRYMREALPGCSVCRLVGCPMLQRRVESAWNDEPLCCLECSEPTEADLEAFDCF